ncbi:hypothetical protein KY308_00160 [Candidatus Woesearchaeota archaeon]|nr:hypothetical protein [Candidatus Woesearchaeota archaeon]
MSSVKFFLILFLVILLVSSCAKQETQVTPTAAQQQATTEQQASEQQTAQQQVQETQGYCGDKVCNDISANYPGADLVCDQVDCRINGKYTENSFSCPQDCGKECDEAVTIGLKPGACKFTENGVDITVKNSGRIDIEGFVFYVGEEVLANKGKIGIVSSSEDVAAQAERTYSIDTSKWEDKFGKVSKIVIVPRVNDVDCSNKGVIVPMTSCRY